MLTKYKVFTSDFAYQRRGFSVVAVYCFEMNISFERWMVPYVRIAYSVYINMLMPIYGDYRSFKWLRYFFELLAYLSRYVQRQVVYRKLFSLLDLRLIWLKWAYKVHNPMNNDLFNVALFSFLYIFNLFRSFRLSYLILWSETTVREDLK